ncbi:MAG: addiction module protein [Bacteroidota bacterium]
MAELVKQIMALPKADRLKIAMQILLSIQEEDEHIPAWHQEELETFQQLLSEEKVTYHSESNFWEEARKRVK